MRCSKSGLLGLSALAALAIFPTAAAADETATCAQQSGDVAIAACSRAIALGRYKGKDLAVLYSNRGFGNSNKGEVDRAIADHSEAIRLDPKDASYYNNRGSAYIDKGDYDGAIADYNEAIRLDPKFAVAYNNRGGAYRHKSDYDRAMADYNEAIRLDPKFALAYSNRGYAYYTRGETDRAIADFDEAIRINPKYAVPYENRGRVRFYKGDFSAAAADLLSSNDVRNNAYTILWRFLARARAGQDAAGELSADAARLEGKDWVYPVIDFYLGRSSLEEMRAAAVTPDQKCEAAFYVGEWHLLRGDNRAAKEELQVAADTCTKTLVEYDGAVAELKRLGP